MTRPDGGDLLWVQLPQGINGQAVYRSALESKILVVPGEVCSTTPRFRDCLRISCALPWPERLSQGMATLRRICYEVAEPKRTASSVLR